MSQVFAFVVTAVFCLWCFHSICFYFRGLIVLFIFFAGVVDGGPGYRVLKLYFYFLHMNV